MTKAMTTSRDLVCSMDVKVAQSTLCTAHRGFVYHFCSTLCLEQFNDIPALYNGSQHIADIRPIPKRRKLRLADHSASDIRRARQRVGEMMGVSRGAAESICLLIECDLRQTILSQIEVAAAAEGLKFMEEVTGSGGVSGNSSNPASWKAQRIQAPGRSATGHRRDFADANREKERNHGRRNP